MKRCQTGMMGMVGIVCMALLTAGCGGTKTALNPNNPTKIKVWNYYTGAQLEAFNMLVKEFNDSEGNELGVVVESTSYGSIEDLKNSLMASAQKEVGADKLPDIFAAYTDTVYDLNQMGLVADMSSYLTDKEKEEYIQNYLEEGDLDKNGSLKIFPVAKSTEIFMLNQTDWTRFAEETGAELSDLQTIEGVTETAEKYYDWTDAMTETPDDGKAFFGRDALANYILIGAKQLGVDILSSDKDGNSVIDFPEEIARKLWDNYYVPFINGYFSAMGRFRSDDVKTGNAICYVGSSSSASFFPKEVIISDTEKYPIESLALAAPVFADGAKYAIQQGAGMAVMKGDDAQIEASAVFLKWFTEEENNIRFSVSSGYLPVKKSANDLEKIKKINDVEDDVSKVLEVSLDTVNTFNMYTTGEKNENVRDILGSSMSDKAIADREQIAAQIEKGISREEAVAAYDTDDNFENWYQEVLGKLQEASENRNGADNK